MTASPDIETIHATTVAIAGRAIVIEGASGAGKSDLALRLIDRGAMLVADDRTILIRDGDRLIARCPETIAGRIEVRGIGIVTLPHVGEAPVALVAALSQDIERLPEPSDTVIAGVTIPLVRIAPFEVSASIKLELALGAIAP